MNEATRKGISTACLFFTVLWFIAIAIFESYYLVRVFRHETTLHDVLGTIYEEQVEGINFVLMLMYLIPGLFAWVMYRRFKKGY